ncbi:MAG: LuxR C-terminal-related transcriptional regulator [Rikenellaceae bacterium]
MSQNRLNILIADPSLIIRRGVMSVLLDIDSLGMNVTELEDITTIAEKIEAEHIDVVIINPMHLGITSPEQLAAGDVRFVALQSFISSSNQLKGYDATISLTDSTSSIEQTLHKLISIESKIETELSTREKEIVKAIALGHSNKEIAESLFISIHTVMTHRKNIASKLKIHNPAGLTIYAIVNKLITIDEVQ